MTDNLRHIRYFTRRDYDAYGTSRWGDITRVLCDNQPEGDRESYYKIDATFINCEKCIEKRNKREYVLDSDGVIVKVFRDIPGIDKVISI